MNKNIGTRLPANKPVTAIIMMGVLLLGSCEVDQLDAQPEIVCPNAEDLSCNTETCKVVNISKDYFQTYLPNKSGFRFEYATATITGDEMEIFTVEKNSRGQSWECTYPDSYVQQYFPVLHYKITEYLDCKK